MGTTTSSFVSFSSRVSACPFAAPCARTREAVEDKAGWVSDAFLRKSLSLNREFSPLLCGHCTYVQPVMTASPHGPLTGIPTSLPPEGRTTGIK